MELKIILLHPTIIILNKITKSQTVIPINQVKTTKNIEQNYR